MRATGGSTAEATLRMAVAGTGRLSRLLQLSHSTARVLVSPSTDAATNLALEDWLFHGPSGTSKPSDGGPVLYLYRNAPSIVLGRNQNPWKQCRMAGLRSQGVQLVRRNSGGGARCITTWATRASHSLALKATSATSGGGYTTRSLWRARCAVHSARPRP
eukprot:COSAG01_NODE_300_length_19226_cov_41.536519_6_plen_160_part_00